jgi:hypothetical protein
MDATAFIISYSLHFLIDVIWFVAHHHLKIIWLHVEILLSVPSERSNINRALLFLIKDQVLVDGGLARAREHR